MGTFSEAVPRHLPSRDRLVRKLDAKLRRRSIVPIIAPAGYGKTTLIEHYLANREEFDVTVHCVQPGDDLRRIMPWFSSRPPIDRGVGSGRPRLLVLDNAHHMDENAEFAALLEDLAASKRGDILLWSSRKQPLRSLSGSQEVSLRCQSIILISLFRAKR